MASISSTLPFLLLLFVLHMNHASAEIFFFPTYLPTPRPLHPDPPIPDLIPKPSCEPPAEPPTPTPTPEPEPLTPEPCKPEPTPELVKPKPAIPEPVKPGPSTLGLPPSSYKPRMLLLASEPRLDSETLASSTKAKMGRLSIKITSGPTPKPGKLKNMNG